MKPNIHYLSLLLKGQSDYHTEGQLISFTQRVLNIGETADCDVRFPQQGAEPVYYASIIRNDDGQSWRIVRRSMAAEVSIAGKGDIGFAQTLADGDRLLFGNQPTTITVNTRYDNRYDQPQNSSRRPLWIVLSLLVVAIVAAMLSLSGRSGSTLTEADVLPLEESVCMVKVDSVQQLLEVKGTETRVLQAKHLDDETHIGTAFITTDGSVITARHCVEYWIATNLDLTTRLSDMPADDITRWAIETETFNQTQPEGSDSVKMLRACFSVYNFLGEKLLSCSSTDPQVHINKDHDGLFLLADFADNYYWRTIRPYFKDQRMAMGDMLRIDSTGLKGKVEIASETDIAQAERGTQLMICGYPMTGTADKRMLIAAGAIKIKPQPEKENIFFESNINHGFSGGPLLMKARRGIVAIGVVSRVDSVSSGIYKWAVPLCEAESR